MEQRLKYLRKLTPKQQKKLHTVAVKIFPGEWDGLDISRLEWKKWWYRCRVWDIRILFTYNDVDGIYIKKISSRGDVYKK